MIQDTQLAQPVPVRTVMSGATGASVLMPRREPVSIERSGTRRARVALRRSTYEVPQRQRVLVAVAGCAAVATIALQAVGFLVL